MRFVIQRVKSAKVSIHGEIAGSIEQGLLVFVGICEQNNFPKPNRENSVPICKYPLPTTAHSLFYWIRMK